MPGRKCGWGSQGFRYPSLKGGKLFCEGGGSNPAEVRFRGGVFHFVRGNVLVRGSRVG